MGELGADTAQLGDLAAALRRSGGDLDRSRTAVGHMVRSVAWHGRDADRFRQRWARSSATLTAAAQLLHDAATEAERNADEQESASANSGAVRRGPRHSVPPFGDPLPEAVETWEGRLRATVGVGMEVGGSVSIEDLPGDESLAWAAVGSGAHAAGGVGIDLGADDAGAELSADGSVGIGALERHGWYVADEGALRAGILAMGGVALSTTGSGVARGLVGLVTGTPTSDADIVDRLFSISAEGAAGLAAGTSIGGVAATGSTYAGIRRRRDGLSLLLESHAEGGAGLVPDLDGPTASGSVRTQVEVGPAVHGRRPVVSTQWSTVGDQVSVRRGVTYYDEGVAGEILDRAIDRAEHGDADGAVRELGRLPATVEPVPSWADQLSGTVDDDVHHVGGTVALGPEVELSVRGGRTLTEFGE